jgi:hypothetical protein
LEILNRDLYKRLPEFPSNTYFPVFVQVMVNNRLAETGLRWTELMTEYNSGFYSSQWVVVDYKYFEVGKPLLNNCVRIVEQIPGISATLDISAKVNADQYFGSFNRPYIPRVRSMSGHSSAEAMYGSLYSYDKSPRGQILYNDQDGIKKPINMRLTMSKNEWPKEIGAGALYPNAPGHDIGARFDIDNFDPIPNGAIDAKVMSSESLRNMECQARSGPPVSQAGTGGLAKPFSWVKADGSEMFPGWPHLGLPDKWNFDWVQMSVTRVSNHMSDLVPVEQAIEKAMK